VRFREAKISDRLFDDIPVGPHTPEEYGFFLSGGSLSARNLERFSAMLEYVRATCVDRSGVVLLKNPRDFKFARRLRRFFPSALFVFIHRRPEHVLRSRARELKDLFARRSEYQAIIEPFYDRLSRNALAMSALRLAARMEPGFSAYLAIGQALDLRAYLHYARHMLSDRDLELRYEDLCARPAETLARILRFLGSSSQPSDAVVARIRPVRDDYADDAPAGGILRALAPEFYRRWRY
jgi:hypothetical protein